MNAIKGKVTGEVQGVGYRMYAYRQAHRLGLKGWIKNNSDGSVSFVCEGSGVDIDFFVDLLKRGNEFSKIDNVVVEATTCEKCSTFTVVE